MSSPFTKRDLKTLEVGIVLFFDFDIATTHSASG